MSILFSGKSTILAFKKKYSKGCGHIEIFMTFHGETVSKYIWVYVSNFNRSSVNRGSRPEKLNIICLI